MSRPFAIKRFADTSERVKALSPIACWVPENGHWYVSIMEGTDNPDGTGASTCVYSGSYGPDECDNAYQALMLGLSDWRNR